MNWWQIALCAVGYLIGAGVFYEAKGKSFICTAKHGGRTYTYGKDDAALSAIFWPAVTFFLVCLIPVRWGRQFAVAMRNVRSVIESDADGTESSGPQ